MSSELSAQAQLSLQVCPIFLTGGIASSVPGGYLPIISLLQPGAFPTGITGAADPDFDLDDSFQFTVNPGASLLKYDLGRYPFANQVTAANAIITEPLNVSMTMIARYAGEPGLGISSRQQLMTSLKQTLSNHALAGGTYVVNTISYPYQNAILRDLIDASSGEVTIPQWRWQWDFEIPLISLQDAAQVAQSYSGLMSRMASGSVVTPDAAGAATWSGTQPVAGNTGSGAGLSFSSANQAAPTMTSSPTISSVALNVGQP